MSLPDRPRAGSLEQRDAPALDATAPTVEGRRLHGLIPYGVESRDLGGWREVIDPGALDGARLDDLVATVDHAGVPIGRHPGTLTLEDRADGMAWSVELPESRSDVREAVERGDLRASSWRMIVARDSWVGDVRHVEAIHELRDVSVVTLPAYATAPAEYRSAPTDPTPEPPAPTTASEEEPTMTEPERTPGGLTVEDRAAQPVEETPAIETRVLDAIRAVSRGESRSLATTTAAAIAPDDIGTFLFDRLRPQSVLLRSGVRVIATDRDAVQLPRLVADVAPGWVNELQAITPSDPTFASLVATPRKLAALVQMSNEIVDDSEPSIVDLLNGHIAQILALRLDLAAFEGTGTAPEIRGLRNVAGIQTVSMGANGAALTSLDPIADAIGLLEAANAQAGAIVMPARTWSQVRKLKEGGTGQYLLSSAGPAGAPALSLFGVPVYVSGQLSTTEMQGVATTASSVYVYDPSQVVLVRRQDASIELDRSRLFNQDASEMRGTLRADLLAPNPTAIVRITGVL